jgi:hypothetical protein
LLQPFSYLATGEKKLDIPWLFEWHPGHTYARLPNSGLGGSVHYEHAVPCSKRLNRAKQESGEWANHSTQRRMHHAEPLVGSTIAQMFQYVNIPINGDVWSDMMRKDENFPNTWIIVLFSSQTFMGNDKRSCIVAFKRRNACIFPKMATCSH